MKQIFGVFLLLVGVTIVLGTYYNIKYFNSAIDVLSEMDGNRTTYLVLYPIIIAGFGLLGFFSFKYGIRLVRSRRKVQSDDKPLDLE